ncbi:G1/S-specific cyclin cln3 [Aphanomyces cochlioides]|nr:G1/S-specific cyclin cln3 [Aphanomyces cochlioides]
MSIVNLETEKANPTAMLLSTTSWTTAAFWLLGLVNNIPYVIMIAGAKDINAGGVGLVYVSEVAPSLIIQLSGPYWFQLVSYRTRLHVAAACMMTSFLTVVMGFRGSLWLQLLGVCFNGIQSAIGESSLLASTALFDDSRLCLTAWSSGTGFAGVAGFAWVTIFTSFASLQTTLLLALIFPVVYVAVFECMLPPMALSRAAEAEEAIPLVAKKHVGLSEGLRLTVGLWPYMLPLVLVYAAEYAMMTGTWAAIGFPLQDPAARELFYRYAGFIYQIGVFVARSSGTWLRVRRCSLLVLSLLQVGFCAFFWTVAQYQVFYNWGLLVPCFVVGCIGGLVYVNAFTLLSDEVDQHTEFALAAASVSMNTGVLVADIAGLWIQGCLYSMHRLAGATIQVDCHV